MNQGSLAILLAAVAALLAISPHLAPAQTAQVQVAFSNRIGLMHIDQMGLGQGGLSEEPMWADRVAEIRALRPQLIRLFVQEYFDLLPGPDRYHFETLDQSVQ